MLKKIIIFLIGYFVIACTSSKDKNTHFLDIEFDAEGNHGIAGECNITYKFHLTPKAESVFLDFGGGTSSDVEDSINIQQSITHLKIFLDENNTKHESYRLVNDTIINDLRKRGILLCNLKKEQQYQFNFQYKYYLGGRTIYYHIDGYPVFLLYPENIGGYIPMYLSQFSQETFNIQIHLPEPTELLSDFDRMEKKNSITTYYLNTNIIPSNLAFIWAKKNTFSIAKNQDFQFFYLRNNSPVPYFDTISDLLKADEKFLNNYLDTSIDKSQLKIFEIPSQSAFTFGENNYMFVDSTFDVMAIAHEFTHKWTTNCAPLGDSLYYFFAESINEFLNFKFYCFYNKKVPSERIKAYYDYYQRKKEEKKLTNDFPIRNTASSKNLHIAYLKAPCILYKIEEKVGEEKMKYFIRKILYEKELSKSIFLDMMEKEFGKDIKHLFLGYLNNTIELEF